MDVFVGTKVRTFRLAKSMSQTDLASQCGITFQQIQKYEKGSNRIGASRLVQFSQILKVPVGKFFDGAPGAYVNGGKESSEPPFITQFMSDRQGVELARAFVDIQSVNQRMAILSIATALRDCK